MSITIASIYWQEVQHTRPLFTPVNIFTLPGVERGAKPALLVIENQIQWEQIPVQHVMRPNTILETDIANDCIRAFTTRMPGMTPQCHPGIWICEQSSPLESEIAAAMEVQKAWAQYLVMQADDKFANPEKRSKVPGQGGITMLERGACRWMGLNREWLQEIRDSEIKTCQFCTKAIPARAIVCPECNRVIDYEGFAIQEKLMEAAKTKATALVEQAAANVRQQQPRV